MIQAIAGQYGVQYTDEEVAALSFEENPIGSSETLLLYQAFPLQTKCVFQTIVKSTAFPIGEIVDYVI